jgi:WD40 repeat protein
MTQATTEIGRDPKTALMLGAAAEELNPDTVTRRQLAGVVTSTFYAGSISDVASAKYLPDGVLVTLGTDGRVSLWNVSDPGRPARIAKTGATGSLLVISPDGRTLAIVDANRKAVLWDIASRSRPARLATVPTAGPVTAMAFSADGTTFVTGEASGVTTLWDTTARTRPTPLAMLGSSGTGAVTGLAISPNGRLLIVATSSTRQGYDLTDPADPVEIDVDISGDINGVIMFSPDGSRLAVGDGSRVNLENMTRVTPSSMTREKAPRDRVEPPPPIPEPEPDPEDVDWEPNEQLSGTLSSYINAVAFSSDNNLVAAADQGGVAEVWDRRIVGDSRYYTLVRAGAPIIELSFNPDATVLVSTDTSGTATLWSVAPAGAPDPVAKLVVGEGEGYTADTVFSLDGRSLFSASTDGTAYTWDTRDPRHPVPGADLVLADGGASSVVFSPDRRRVATINSRPWGTSTPINLMLADVASPARTTTLTNLPHGNWGSPVFSPDGRTLAVGFGETTIQLWNVADHSAPVRLGAMTGHSDDVVLLAFSPDGRSLVSAAGSSAMLWDVTDRLRPYRLAMLPGHADRVGAVAFTPDGRTLATGDMIAKVNLWDTTDPARPIRLAKMNGTFRHETKERDYSQIRGLTFRSDGRTLAITGQAPNRFENPDIALWDYRKLNSLRADPARTACTLTGRGLTAAEWARYIPEIKYRHSCPN